MRDWLINLIYLPTLVISAMVLVMEVRRRPKRRLRGSIIFLAAMLMGWQLGSMLYYFSFSYESAYFLHDMCLPFVSFSTLGLLLMVVRFYSLDAYMPRALVAVLFIVPIITTVLVLTAGHHNYIREYLAILSLWPEHQSIALRGPWFWIHTGYSYSLAVIAIVVAIWQHTRLPKVYRLPSTILIAGLLFSIVGNILVLSTSVPVDLSLIGASFSLIPLYVAINNHQELDFLIRARNELFNYLDDAIFVLDDDAVIIQKNQAASDWLAFMGCNTEEASYSELAGLLYENMYVDGQRTDVEEGVDIVREAAGETHVFNLREKPILDNEGKQIGLLAICRDVTENRNLIYTLDETCGLDALTGLSNLHRMQQAVQEVDTENRLPITIVMADLNNLKSVNDTFGHQQGDVLLRVVAETLLEVCPPSAFLGRTGGDEFLVLLPNTTASQASAIVADIKYRLKNVKGHPFVPSLAVGYAVKEHPAQHIKDLVQQADANMYADKNLMRKVPREQMAKLG